MEKIASIQRVKDLFSEYGLTAKKSRGQNFLIDSKAVEKMVLALNPQKDEQILEIGPGLGALTQALLEKDSKVVAIELDRDLVQVLNEKLKPQYNKLTVINRDFLKSDWQDYKPTKIVGNLPYYITTPLITEILKKDFSSTTLLFTIQWEVARKLTAKPATKDYGFLSAALQCFGEPEIIAKLPPHNFWPQPNVASGVVLIKKRSPEIDPQTNEKLWEVLRLAFSQRRKTLQNNLASLFSQGQLSSIDLKRRAESLNYREFLTIAEELTKK